MNKHNRYKSYFNISIGISIIILGIIIILYMLTAIINIKYHHGSLIETMDDINNKEYISMQKAKSHKGIVKKITTNAQTINITLISGKTLNIEKKEQKYVDPKIIAVGDIVEYKTINTYKPEKQTKNKIFHYYKAINDGETIMIKSITKK